jgi:hypothetical protein
MYWAYILVILHTNPPAFRLQQEELVVDENAKVFLSNKLIKLRRKHAQTTADIVTRQKDLESLQNVRQSYISNGSLGDPDEANENILLTSRDIMVLQTMNALSEAEINTIVQAIGGMVSFLAVR